MTQTGFFICNGFENETLSGLLEDAAAFYSNFFPPYINNITYVNDTKEIKVSKVRIQKFNDALEKLIEENMRKEAEADKYNRAPPHFTDNHF